MEGCDMKPLRAGQLWRSPASRSAAAERMTPAPGKARETRRSRETAGVPEVPAGSIPRVSPSPAPLLLLPRAPAPQARAQRLRQRAGRRDRPGAAATGASGREVSSNPPGAEDGREEGEGLPLLAVLPVPAGDVQLRAGALGAVHVPHHHRHRGGHGGVHSLRLRAHPRPPGLGILLPDFRGPAREHRGELSQPQQGPAALAAL